MQKTSRQVNSSSKVSIPTIVIDTREQKPYVFTSGRVGSVKKALPAGDYSLEGFESQVAIERKTLSDLVSTVVHSQERFKRELKKLLEYKYAFIVAECSIEDIILHRYRSKVSPKALLGILSAIMVDYIPIYFAGNRQCAIVLVEALLLRCYKRIGK